MKIIILGVPVLSYCKRLVTVIYAFTYLKFLKNISYVTVKDASSMILLILVDIVLFFIMN